MKNVFLLISLILCGNPLFAEQDSIFRIDSIPEFSWESDAQRSVHLNKYWKYQKGDDLQWAQPDYNDKFWSFLSTNLNLEEIPENTFAGIAWFRLHVTLDSSIANRTLGLVVNQLEASEIYLNGKLIHSFGKVDPDNRGEEERFNPQGIPVDIRFERAGKHLIAVRYSNAKGVREFNQKRVESIGYRMEITQLRQGIFAQFTNSNIATAIFTFYFTFFLALSFLHFIFFLFYPATKSNLYYSIFAGTLGLVFIGLIIMSTFTVPDFVMPVNYIFSFLPNFYVPALFAMLYSIFYKRIPKLFWLWFSLYAIDLLLGLFYIQFDYFNILLYAIFAIESLRIIISAIIRKLEGSWIIGGGIITTVFLFSLFFVLQKLGNTSFYANSWMGAVVGVLVMIGTISIPLSMTIFLARDFAKTSKNLEKKLMEVEMLSEKSIEQEKEKQKILETQKEVLEEQVKERTSEIVEQKKVIEEKNKDITDSINYARHIQQAMLPFEERMAKSFAQLSENGSFSRAGDFFIYFKPKDIVSGDFYWFTEKGGKIFITVVDCTGHGVPGAFMSMIGSSVLNLIINDKGIYHADIILDEMHKEIRKALKQDETNSRDGMDVALCVIDTKNKTLEFAGANNPLWIISEAPRAWEDYITPFGEGRGGVIKPDKYAIGGMQLEKDRKFTRYSIKLDSPMSVYLFSDGLVDQFGGPKGKKFKSKPFQELLLSIQDKSMPEQKVIIDQKFEGWKAWPDLNEGRELEQIDDVCVIGLRL